MGGNYLHNLFNDHRGGPLFQADANYGATAGVAEMLLQSQDHVVAPLTAMPATWSEGSYRGLLARGNFEVSAQWSGGHASRLEVLSKSGGTLELRYPNVAQAVIKTTEGQTVDFVAKGSDQVSIETTQGKTYVVTDIPVCIPVTAPSNLKLNNDDASDQIELSWTGSADAASYNLYRAVGNAPDYELDRLRYRGHQFHLQSLRPETDRPDDAQGHRGSGRWARERRGCHGDPAAADEVVTNYLIRSQGFAKQVAEKIVPEHRFEFDTVREVECIHSLSE